MLLLPVAWLLERGRWWAIAIPLVTMVPLVDVTPPIAHPLLYWATLAALLREGRATDRWLPAQASPEAGDTIRR